MTEQNVLDRYNNVYELLQQRRLGISIQMLEGILSQTNNWSLVNELDGYKSNYSYMMKYMKDGIIDSNHSEMFNNIIFNVWTIANKAKLSELDNCSTKLYHKLSKESFIQNDILFTRQQLIANLEKYYNLVVRHSEYKEDISEEELSLHEETIRALFKSTWLNRHWNSEDTEDARHIIYSDSILIEDKALFVSAIMLSILDCFDLTKALFVAEMYKHQNIEISQRAIVALIIILHTHSKQLRFCKQFSIVIGSLCNEEEFRQDFETAYKQILQQQDTEEISRKMREEIIPEVMKSTSKLSKNTGNMDFLSSEMEEDISSLFDDDDNNEFKNTLKEIEELQTEGADVNMGTFTHLRGFPFFKNIHNWFYPFSFTKREVYTDIKKHSDSFKSKLKFLMSMSVFCEIDKYSFFFITNQIPSDQQENMFIGLENGKEVNVDTEEFEEFLGKQGLKGGKKNVVKCYLQDLYRFVKQYSFGKEFTNIFNETIELYNLDYLSKILFDTKSLMLISNFYFKKKRWTEYISISNKIIERMNEEAMSSSFYKKLGYAYQKNMQYTDAISNYKRAYSILPTDMWTLNRLSMCYRMIGDYRDAIYYCRVIEEIEEQNPTNIFNMARCLAELGSYKEAINYYLKYTFIEKETINAWRGIAWCSMLEKDYQQAQKYYDKILSDTPVYEDYMNYGNVCFIMSDITKAISCYQKAKEKLENIEEFEKAFYQNKDLLISNNISLEEQATMIDIIAERM